MGEKDGSGALWHPFCPFSFCFQSFPAPRESLPNCKDHASYVSHLQNLLGYILPPRERPLWILNTPPQQPIDTTALGLCVCPSVCQGNPRDCSRGCHELTWACAQRLRASLAQAREAGATRLRYQSPSSRKTPRNVRCAVKGARCSAVTLACEPFTRTVTSHPRRLRG